MRRRCFLAGAAGATLAHSVSSAASQETARKGYDFVQVDVFTKTPLEGNQLAVFTDAEGLTALQMQNIARELQHSETTFIFPASAGGDARVRIFGPDGEFPFAGHPTLGTAFVMAKSIKNKKRLILEENVGPIPVDLERRSDGLYLEMKQNDPTFGIKPEPTMLARALGFEVGEIDDRYAPQVVSTGLPWLIIPLKSASTLEKLQHGRSLPPDEAKRIGASPYFLVTGERDIEARVFGVSGPEDPATGSGAGDAVSFMTRYGIRKPNQNLTIYQGRFANRPSVIYASASLGGGSVTNVRVGGHVVEVMRGRITM